MGCRRQPRIPITIAASLCGMDAKGRAFVDRVRLVNMSRGGAQIEDVTCAVKTGDMVALRCDDMTRRCRVIWTEPGDGQGRQVGLEALGPVPAIMEKWLPGSESDEYLRPRTTQRRTQARYECEVATEIRLRGSEAPMWVTASDISEGGCRVQIPHAMTPLTEVSVAFWLDGERVWVHGVVTHCIYGCGTGIRFTRLQQSTQHKFSRLFGASDKQVSERRESTEELNQLCAAFSVTS